MSFAARLFLLPRSVRGLSVLFPAFIAVVLVSIPGVSRARLIGDEVNFRCTNCGPPTSDNFIVVAGGSPELSLFDQFEVDVEAESLRINWIFDSFGIIGDLNLVWSDLDWTGVPGTIVGVSVDPSSTWGQDAFVAFTSDSVSLTNNNDSSVAVGDYWLAHLEVSHVPEPASLVLFGFGLFVLEAGRRRRKSIAS